MTYGLATIIYLYIVGAAGFGAVLINDSDRRNRTKMGVVDMLLVIAWPLTGFVWLLAAFIGELRHG